MKASLDKKADAAACASIDLIHKTLYSFSNNNLHTLLRENAAFRYILADSLKKKDEIFINSFKNVPASSEPGNEIN